MITGVALQNPLLRQEVMEKTNLCLRKRSMINASVIFKAGDINDFLDCLVRSVKPHITKLEREFLETQRRAAMQLQVSKQMRTIAIMCVLTINIDTEDGNDISRSSSVSGKAKRGKMVKKHRTDSESFDVRSQYTPFFPPQQPQAWTPTQPGTIGTPQYSNVLQNSFSGPAAPQYGPTPPHFHPSMVAGGAPTAYHQMPQVSPTYDVFVTKILTSMIAIPEAQPSQLSEPWCIRTSVRPHDAKLSTADRAMATHGLSSTLPTSRAHASWADDSIRIWPTAKHDQPG